MTSILPRSVLLLALLVCTAATAFAQAGAPAISGRVLAAETETPLRRARVAVTRGILRSVVLTDNDGRFAVEVPGAGAPVPFDVTVTKGGYMTVATKVERKDLDSSLLVRLVRGAAIAGVAVDRDNRPVTGMAITAARVGSKEAGTPAQYTTTTDDRGEYRLTGLSGGRYEVWAGTPMRVAVSSPATAGGKTSSTLHEIGTGEKTALTLQTSEEIGGVQLVAPDAASADAALRLLRESGRIPPNAATTVLSSGVGSLVLFDSTMSSTRRGAPAIRGRVFSSTRTPVQGVTVRVTRAGVQTGSRTNADGTFSVEGLEPGEYTVHAGTAGQIEWQFGQRASGQAGRPITVGRDQIVEGIEIVLPPTLAISGFVVDEHGEAVENASVQALQLRYVGGRLTTVAIGPVRSTDDRGRYRLWGMHAGSYLVAASVDGLVGTSNGTAYARTYFPGTPTLGAAFPVDLREDATANLAFTPSGLATVRVIARDGDGPLVAGTARLVFDRRSGSLSEPLVVNAEKDGSFLFRNVPPGDYVVQVRGDGPGRTGLFGTQELTVGFDPVTVTLPTSYGVNLEGRVVVEGTTGRPSVGLRIVPLDDRARDPSPEIVQTSGEYFVTNLFGSASLALRSAPSDNWYLKSWMVNGNDVSDTGYDFGARPDAFANSDIVISGNGASITGRVDNRVKPVDDYGVIVFPASRDLRLPHSRRMKFNRSALDGTFRVAGLPPGDYLVAAVSSVLGTADSGEWQNPDVLLQLESRAERITLLDGQAAKLTLRLIER